MGCGDKEFYEFCLKIKKLKQAKILWLQIAINRNRQVLPMFVAIAVDP